MPDISEIKEVEMSKIIDFHDTIDKYGHIFQLDPKLLDEPFRKIMEGIEAVEQMMDDSYGM